MQPGLRGCRSIRLIGPDSVTPVDTISDVMKAATAPKSSRSALQPAAATAAAYGDGSLAALLDPRASSTQSLVPSLTESVEGVPRRRKLLVIYVHGFMGNDSSFRSFPAHVHNFLKQSLVETHSIHTKIYPRYKTYKSINLARDNFSRWLEPHEAPTTDVVLVGHSMGGLLAADVALMVSRFLPAPGPVTRRLSSLCVTTNARRSASRSPRRIPGAPIRSSTEYSALSPATRPFSASTQGS